MPRAAALIIEGRCVAVIERRNTSSPTPYFVFPGGGIEAGEKPEEAAAREVWEELGLHVVIEQCVATVQYAGSNQYYFVAHITDGNFGTGRGAEMSGPTTPEKGTYTPRWLPLVDLHDAPVYPQAVARMVVESAALGWPAQPLTLNDYGRPRSHHRRQ